MIKQTSGAISFLLAAYRAILKKNFLLALTAATSLSVSGNTLAYTLDQVSPLQEIIQESIKVT